MAGIDKGRLLRSVSAPGLSPGQADSARARIRHTAAELIQALRTDDSQVGPVDALMREDDLSSDEGVGLMTLAEALLRIPDGATRDLLIRDKLAEADWGKHVGRSDSTFVNLSSWALALTGRAMRATDAPVWSAIRSAWSHSWPATKITSVWRRTQALAVSLAAAATSSVASWSSGVMSSLPCRAKISSFASKYRSSVPWRSR